MASARKGTNWKQAGKGKTGEVEYSGSDARTIPEQISAVLDLEMTNSTSRRGEYGFVVNDGTSEVCVATFCKTEQFSAASTPVKIGSGPQGTIRLTVNTSAIGHTHPTGGSASYRASNEFFGPGDHASVVLFGKPNFVYTPSGTWKVLEGHSGYLWQTTLSGPNAGQSEKWIRTMD